MASPNIVIEPGEGNRASITVDDRPASMSKVSIDSNLDAKLLVKDGPAKQSTPNFHFDRPRAPTNPFSQRPIAQRPIAQRPKPPPLNRQVPPSMEDLDDFDLGSNSSDEGSERSLSVRNGGRPTGEDDMFGNGGGFDNDSLSGDDEDKFEADPVLKPSLGYKTLDEEKSDLLFKLGRMRQKANIADGQPFTIHSDIRDVRAEFARVKATIDIEGSIRFQRRLLTTVVSGLEWANGKWGRDYLDMDLDGFSEHTYENISDFDNIFEKLHEKYRGTGGSMPPELQLLLMLAGSAVSFNMSKKLFKNAPELGDVLKNNPQLMQNVMNAAAQHMSNAQAPPAPVSTRAQPQTQAGPKSPARTSNGRREMRGPPVDVGGILGGGLGGALGGGLGGGLGDFNPLGMLLGGGLSMPPMPQATRTARADEVREIATDAHQRPASAKKRRQPESVASSSDGSAYLSEDGMSLPSNLGDLGDLGDLLSDSDGSIPPGRRGGPPKKQKRVLRL